MFKTNSLMVVGWCALGLVACDMQAPEEDPFETALALVGDANPFDGVQQCGGLAGLPCPNGARCVDRPADGCDPGNGGTDCIGLCVYDPIETCAGFVHSDCPAGGICIDDPRDKCDPDASGADCPGVCMVGDGVSE